MPSFKMMGLNSSTAGVEKHTAPAHNQYCFVRSICPGERSRVFFAAWLLFFLRRVAEHRAARKAHGK